VTTIVGGLRARLIHDSVEAHVFDILNQLGWFDAGRRHTPIVIVPKPKKWDEPIPFNSIAIDLTNNSDEEAEMGSNLTNETHIVNVDFYGENEAIARHVAGDLAAAFRGKMPSISRTTMSLPVFDFRDPAAPVLFSCQVETVAIDKAHNFPHPWQQFWHSVRFDLIDTYGDEND
jgi:hypothetical protein